MPQATPARNTDRDRLRTRPSVAARGVSAEQAPVLFRLPIIMAAPAMQNGAALDSVPSPPIPPPVVERSAVASAAAAGAAATVSFPAVNVVGPPSAHSPQANSSQTSATQPVAAAGRSWWEHWSSGVVLILLIIALVTASILALNDAGKPKVEQLAGEPVAAAADEFDLSNITIPDIASSKPTVVGDATSRAPKADSTASMTETAESTTQNPVTNPESAAAKSPTTKTMIREGALELSSVPPAASTFAASPVGAATTTPAPTPLLTTTASPNTASPNTVGSSTPTANPPNSKPASSGAAASDKVASSPVTSSPVASTPAAPAPQATLTLPAAANLVAKPQSATSGDTSPATQSTAPLASLALPVGVALPPLFNANAPTEKVGGVPSFTASGPTAAATNGNGQSAGTAAQPAPGASPTFYDGAALGPELHAATDGRDTNPIPNSLTAAAPQTAMSNSGAANGGPVDTNLPSYETILASATRPVAGSNAGAAAQPAVGMTDSYGRSVVVATATPELDTQALNSAYYPYNQTNKANTGAASNRFEPAPQTPPPPAAGRGFMLGNP